MKTRNLVAGSIIITLCTTFGIANSRAHTHASSFGQEKQVAGRFSRPREQNNYRDAMVIPPVEGGFIPTLPREGVSERVGVTINVPEITVYGYLPAAPKVSAAPRGNWRLYQAEVGELGHNNNSFSGQ